MGKEKEKETDAELHPSPALNSMDSLTANEELPEVKENAIAAVQSKNEKDVNTAKENGFDPNIHATNKDGSPKLTASGNFAKKRGRKSVLNTGQKSDKEQKAEAEAEKQKQENLHAAQMTSLLLETAQCKFISDDFRYSDIERQTNIDLWDKTYEYYGGVAIPPPLALAVDHMAIILVRANKPTTKDKITIFKTWLKTKFSRKKKDGSLSDNREDSIGKNDLRKEEG